MTRRLYLAPIVTLAIGNRSPLASKVLEYGRPPNVSSVLSRNKTWAITSADFDDTQHALVAADAEITPIPFGSLDNTWNDFTVQQRTAIGNRLEALNVPMDWITVNTSVADLLRMAARVALLGQMLKADALDDVSLDSTFGQLPASRRNRILTWANDNDVDTTGLTNSTTIRAMLRALVVRYPWNTTHELPFMRSGAAQFSISVQILKQKLRRGEISIEDLPFSAQVTVSDDFNRANTTDLGLNWSEDTGGPDWEIISNQLEYDGTVSDYFKCRWVGTALASNDYYIEADIITGTNANIGMGVGGRLAAGIGDANSDGYDYIFYSGDASYLIEHADSGEAILDTGGATSNSTTYSNSRLTCNGSALTGTRNGAADVSATDATYSSGSVGIWAFDGNNTNRIDNWEAADLAAAAASLVIPRHLRRQQSIYVR